MVTKKKEYKLDLFPLLDDISEKNLGRYDTFTEENIKAFTPYLIMRWLTNCNYNQNVTAHQIYFLNELVNPYAFEFTKRDCMHKKLLYQLLTISTTGKKCKYSFLKVKKKIPLLPLATKIVQEVFSYSSKDAEDATLVLSDEAIIDMAEQLGRQDGELKLLKRELKTKRPK